MIQTLDDKIATYSENMILKISKYTQYDLDVIFQINTAYQLHYIKSCLNDHLIIVFETGKIDFLKIKGNKVYSINFTCSDEHDKPISALAYNSKYIVTGGNDCRIKVWTYSKQMIKNINFNDPVRSIDFIADTDEVIISHAQSITRFQLNIPNYYSETPEIDEVTPDYYQEADIEVVVTQASEPISTLMNLEPDYLNRTRERRESALRQPRASNEGFNIDEEAWNEFLKKSEITSPHIMTIKDVSILESSRLSLSKKHRGSLKPRKSKKSSSKDNKHHKKYLKSLKKPPSPMSNFIQEEYRHLISMPNERLPVPKKLPPPAFITRRMLTQEKIIANVKRFGDPCDYIDPSGLHVMEDPSLPPIHTNY